MNLEELTPEDDDLTCELCGRESFNTGMYLNDSERIEICDDCDTLIHWCLACASGAQN